MHGHALVQILVHRILVASNDLFVAVSTFDHAVVVRMTKLVENQAARLPQVLVLPVIVAGVDFDALRLLRMHPVVDQPALIGMVAASDSRHRAHLRPVLDRFVHPNCAVLLQVLPCVIRQQLCGGFDIGREPLFKIRVATVPILFQPDRPAAHRVLLVPFCGGIERSAIEDRLFFDHDPFTVLWALGVVVSTLSSSSKTTGESSERQAANHIRLVMRLPTDRNQQRSVVHLPLLGTSRIDQIVHRLLGWSVPRDDGGGSRKLLALAGCFGIFFALNACQAERVPEYRRFDVIRFQQRR
mmetsp:Transcript_12381/g.35935  ORF Transcript_12381/g.35935 Transcript_12381/m.35935 type:complete len:298 (-) Transcript_12381:433-1326(-)